MIVEIYNNKVLILDLKLFVSKYKQFFNALTMDNPEYESRKRSGRSVWGVSKKLYLYNWDMDTCVIGIGCITTGVLELLEKDGAVLEVKDKRYINAGACVDYPKNTFSLRPYQFDAVRKTEKYVTGIISAPTGAGKTVIGLSAIGRSGTRAVWLTHTLDLIAQTVAKAKLMFPGIDIGVIGGGKVEISKHITVASVKTLISKPELIPELNKSCDFLVVDEAHHTPSSTFTQVCSALNMYKRIGLTATPYRADGLDPFMFAALGSTLYEVDREYLYKQKALIRPMLKLIYTDFVYEPSFNSGSIKADGKLDYVDLVRTLLADADRMQQMLDNVKTEAAKGSSQLILINSHVGLEQFAEGIRNAGIGEVAVLHGKLNAEERRDVLQRVTCGGVKILLATQLAKEGLDIPRLNALHLITPRKGDVGSEPTGVSLEQEVGRVMRPFPGKESAVIYDYVDYNVSVLKAQHYSRNRVYKRLGIDVPKKPKENFDFGVINYGKL